MSCDIDLNIDNYDFDDILCLFKLPYHYSEKEMKAAKKIVLQTHPDKSGLDKEYFLFFSKAYKLLYKVFVFRSKVNTNQRDDKDYDAEDVEEFEKENEELIERIKNSKNFNRVFNELFVNMNMVQQENGYGDWLKTENTIDLPKCKTPKDMPAIMNKHRESMSSALIKQDIQDFYTSKCDQHNLDGIESSYGSGLFSKLQYDDLKTAHEESIIPVINSDNLSQKTYNTVLQERSVVDKPVAKHTAETMLKQQMLMDEKKANVRAFRLAKETTQNEEKQTIWWSKFKQIMDG
tara:strand:- start:2404 stop:3276 length:873 start_codon:yes stop_codon:yes gene_type:complete